MDGRGSNSHTDTYQVPYEYYILTVNLKNRTLPVVINDRLTAGPKGALFGYHVDEGQQALICGITSTQAAIPTPALLRDTGEALTDPDLPL